MDTINSSLWHVSYAHSQLLGKCAHVEYPFEIQKDRHFKLILTEAFFFFFLRKSKCYNQNLKVHLKNRVFKHKQESRIGFL
jgi:hypothetical protein